MTKYRIRRGLFGKCVLQKRVKMRVFIGNCYEGEGYYKWIDVRFDEAAPLTIKESV